MAANRPPAAAGRQYPAEARELTDLIRSQLAQGRADMALDPEHPPKAVLVAHSDYSHCGHGSAAAYARVEVARSNIRKVVLLGPVQQDPPRGIALTGYEAFSTPLGDVPVDQQAARALAEALPEIVHTDDEAHRREISLEVQLPFLQEVLDEFTFVPLAVGRAIPVEVAAVLDLLWGGEETLVVASSALSRSLRQEEARAVDEVTIGQILDGRGALTAEQASGATPVNGLLLAVQNHRLIPELLDTSNSGDTGGDPLKVTGHASFVFRPSND
ncbi:AmmeMemoRadiSam system protein B [Austwickia chelonae]|uniref:AmmeMemoRadiSam system protein B n=1 Tax=Austwickia chelonae TaxID=100225 RepID=UPI000E241AFD|nr:AmmeMemoRadiSam system protein B [Austwickia chelonae]